MDDEPYPISQFAVVLMFHVRLYSQQTMNRIFVTVLCVFCAVAGVSGQPTNRFCIWRSSTGQNDHAAVLTEKYSHAASWGDFDADAYDRPIARDAQLLVAPHADPQASFGSFYTRYGTFLPQSTPVFQRIAFVTDDRTAAALRPEIERWKDDVVREGFDVDEIVFAPTGSVAADVRTVKRLISQIYRRANAGALTHVFLFGQIPIPYSGGFSVEGAVSNPDGHREHGGAWATDLYYADLERSPGMSADEDWTDSVVTITSDALTNRVENKNQPGDGKFDQSQIPSDVEVAVGRVDFRRLPTYGVTSDTSMRELELLRRYLDKDHTYRTTTALPPFRALIDDNFGAFIDTTANETTIEAFAASGWRSFSAIVGSDNIVEGDWFATDTRPNLTTSSALLAYGCGGGGYEHCSWVGATTDFALKPVNAVFTLLFGSYFADFDSDDNVMRASLANEGTILTSAWSGRPHWFLHPLAHGETIGDCAVLSQNNGGAFMGAMVLPADDPTKARSFRLGLRGVQNNLHGDPSLRLPYPFAMTPCQFTTMDGQEALTITLIPGVQVYEIEAAPTFTGPYRQILRYQPSPDSTHVTVPLYMNADDRFVRVRPMQRPTIEHSAKPVASVNGHSYNAYGRAAILERTVSSIPSQQFEVAPLRIWPTVIDRSCRISAQADPASSERHAIVTTILGEQIAVVPLAEHDGRLEGTWWATDAPPSTYLITLAGRSRIVQVIR